MPFQGLPWTEFISCPVCFKVFNERQQRPISLGCGHTVCKSCIRNRLNDNRCPFDQTMLPSDVDKLPANFALMHLVGAAVPEQEKDAVKTVSDNPKSYEQARKCIEEMAVHLKPLAENASDDDSSTCSDPSPSKGSGPSGASPGTNSNNINVTSVSKCVLSRPMQRKLISLIHCQLLEEEGRSRAARIARSLGERIVSELLVLHQYPHQLSANLWAAVRTRGCQFLGPAMQEEVLKLILLALEDGSFLSRKVLVLFVVQRLESRYPQASKTAIGHVVQLLYRASCFKVLKRDEESSLMQLKEEFRQYESLRREHDSQIVQIALEAGLRISPEQWSSLLYGDPAHKSHMQSIIDKHQSPQSFAQSVTELMLNLQKSTEHIRLVKLQPQLEFLSNIDPSPDCPAPSWENLEAVMRSLNTVMTTFVDFLSNPDHKSRLESIPVQSTRYKTSMCRDFTARGTCPRGNTCTFAHSQEELERYRSRSRRNGSRGLAPASEKSFSSLSVSESDQLRQVMLLSNLKEESVTKQGTAKITGSSQFVVDSKCFTSASSLEMPPTFNSLPMTPPHMTGLLHSKVPPEPGDFMGTKLYDPDKPPFIGHTQQLITETRLTFSCPAVDGQDNPTNTPQACFQPNPPNKYPQSSLLQNPQAHSLSVRQQLPYIPTQANQLALHPPNPSYPLPLPPNIHHAPAGTVSIGPSSGALSVSTFLPPPCGELNNMTPMKMSPQQSAETPIIWTGGVPYVHTQPAERPQVLPYQLQGGDTLEDLTTRKQQIINDLQEEPVFLDSGASIYLADGHKGFAGLKSVLSTNKHRHGAMPKSVTDMYVATRSTQSLDELRNDDVQHYTPPWSNGEDNLSEISNGITSDAFDASQRGPLPNSNTTNSIFSTTAATTSGPQESTGNRHLYSNVESKSGEVEVSITTQSSSGNDAEFCSFPNDDNDEAIIPFEHISVSKFGPISRMSKVKMYNSAPVQVTADSYKWMTPVLSVIPMDRPVATSMQMPTRYSCRGAVEFLSTEPSVKPTPLEIPSIWQHTPQPSYHNIALMKAGAAEAFSNNERLAYELQAVELEIAMKTGKEPEPFTKIIQDAVMASSQSQALYRPSSDLVSMRGSNFATMMSQGHVPDHLVNMNPREVLISSHQSYQPCTYTTWQGTKK